MPDQPTTPFLTRMLRRGAAPFAQAGSSFGISRARAVSSTPEDFSSRSPRGDHSVDFDDLSDLRLKRQTESIPSSRQEPRPVEAASLEKPEFSFPQADAEAINSNSLKTESLLEGAIAPEAKALFHPPETRLKTQTRSGGVDEEVDRISSDPVQPAPRSSSAVSSFLPPDHRQEHETAQSLLPEPREAGQPAPPERQPPRREFRIIEPAMLSQPVQYGGPASPARNTSGEEQDGSPSRSEQTPSRKEARFQNSATEERRESPGTGTTQTSRILIESAFKSVPQETLKTEARRPEVYSANTDELSPKETWRRGGAPLHQERGARVTVNRLEIQIINQQPPAPAQLSPRASAPAADAQFGLDRQLLGRFDLIG